MTEDNGKDTPGVSDCIRESITNLKTIFRGIYGTDMHIIMKEERDHASEAIIRMAEEADNIKQATAGFSVDQVLLAMVRDLES